MRLLSVLSAYIFHPLFSFIYTFFFLVCLKPHWFGINHFSDSGLLIILVLIYTCVIPLVAVALLKFVGLIKSFEMTDKYDRIIPLIICLIFYLWMYVNLKKDDNIPKVFIAFILGSIISIVLAFVINNWMKLSLHMLAFGSMLCFWLSLRLYFCQDGVYYFRLSNLNTSEFHLNHFIGILIFLSGWVGSSRILLGVHNLEEVYFGFIIGFISILLALSYTF